MEEKSLVALGTPLSAQTKNVLIIEQFLNDNYRLRRNMLSGKVEFKSRAELSAEYRPLTQEALNSIIIRALREGLDEEVIRIQQMNLGYMQQKDIAEMVKICFRKPKDGEKVKSLSTTEMLEIIRNEYPNVTITTRAKIELGRALVSLDYERKDHSHVAYYKAVPLKVA